MKESKNTPSAKPLVGSFEAPKMPYVAFGPRSRENSLIPTEVAAAREAAFRAIKNLHGMILRGTCKDAALEQLAEVGALAATFLEGLWGSEKHKNAVEAVASHRVDFPILVTGPSVLGYEKRLAMRKSLPLAGTAQQWAKTQGNENHLRRELDWFVIGVRNPGWLHCVDRDGERDVIKPETREHLRRTSGARAPTVWTRAFENYIKTYRPDLICQSGLAGRYKALAQQNVNTYGIKDHERAFFRYVRDQFRSILKRPRIRK